MKNKITKLTVATTVVCLLPVVLGLALYSQLPQSIPVHWNIAGEVDRYFSKPVVVFGLPLLLAVLNVALSLRQRSDPEAEAQPKPLRVVVAWMPAAVAAIMIPVSLFSALDKQPPIILIANLIVGVVLVVVGNYLPKTRHNHTMGLKFSSALRDEENWNKTHRMAGYVWIAGGVFVLIASIFTQNKGAAQFGVVAAVVAVIVLVPRVYSHRLYKKSLEKGGG